MIHYEGVPITSSELGYLWTGYTINEMSKWYLTIFAEHAKDQDVKSVLCLALNISNDLLEKGSTFLSKEGYPLPLGFNQEDIDINATPLFTDRFILFYMLVSSRLGLAFHSKSLALSTREDIRAHHIDCLQVTIQLHTKISDTALNKGLYWRTPTLPAPLHPEKVQKASYLNGWLGDTRPLNSMEMANLYSILELLIVINTICTGFSQTTTSNDLKNVFIQGSVIAKDQFYELAEALKKDDLPLPPTSSTEITTSNNRVFSDRIMLCHVAGLFGSLISQSGFSLGAVMAHNLVTIYSKLIAVSGKYSEKITKILIEKKSLEKVPGAVSRKV